MLFSFMSDTFTGGPVTLRGLVPGMEYDLVELDTGLPHGVVTGPTATLAIAFHRQSAGKPWWLLLGAIPRSAASSVPPLLPPPSAWRPDRALTATPNPARGAVAFAISLPPDAPVAGSPPRLAIFDIRGRLVRELTAPASASSSVTWDGLDAAAQPVTSGIYFARLSWAGGAAIRRVLLAR
jgi:hypothetical protein